MSHFSFSSRQYAFFASIWRDIVHDGIIHQKTVGEMETIKFSATVFADALASAHDNFDRDRFMKNIYGPFSSDETL